MADHKAVRLVLDPVQWEALQNLAADYNGVGAVLGACASAAYKRHSATRIPRPDASTARPVVRYVHVNAEAAALVELLAARGDCSLLSETWSRVVDDGLDALMWRRPETICLMEAA